MKKIDYKRIKNNFKEFLTKDKKMKAVVFWLFMNLLYIFVGSFLVTVHTITYKRFSQGYRLFGIINIFLGIIICIKNKKKPNIIHYLIVIMLICGIISTILSPKKLVSIFGIGGRYEGIIMLTYYYSVLFLSMLVNNNKYKKFLIVTILVTGVVQAIYAIMQIYAVEHIYRMTYQKKIWATGFATNPNFFGTYMLLCVTYSLGLYFEEKNIKKKIALILVSALCFVGLIISNTTSCTLAFVIILVFIIIHCIKNKKYKELIACIVLTISMIVLMTALGKTNIIKDYIKLGNETTQVATGNADTTFGSNRFYIWKNTLPIIPKNLLHGAGVDNFYYAFDGKPLASHHGIYYDKVHNEYLQILVTEGLVCLLAYLSMYGLICFKGFKYYLKSKKMYLLIPVVAYLIQAFFNISVIEVAPVFFMALGLCATSDIEDKKEDKTKVKSKKVKV